MNKKATGAVSVPERPKSLANCNIREFLRQTERIKESVQKWLTVTDIMNVRRRKADILAIPDGATAQEKAEIEEKNKKAIAAQAKENISAMLDAMLKDHLDETIEVLALCCFIEPEDAENYPVKMYLHAVTDLLNDEDVSDFFGSLVHMARGTGFME